MNMTSYFIDKGINYQLSFRNLYTGYNCLLNDVTSILLSGHQSVQIGHKGLRGPSLLNLPYDQPMFSTTVISMIWAATALWWP